MANTFLTTDLISNVTLAKFVNNNSMLMTANRGLEGDFKNTSYKIGDTVNIRKRNHFTVNDGRVAQLQDVIEDSEPLVINHQYNTAIEYSSKDLTLDIDDFSSRLIDPAIQEIVHRMETDIAQQGVNELYFHSGTAGTPINSFASVDLAGVQMLEHAMPILEEAYMALSVRDASALKASLQNAFNDTLNEEISLRSALGRLSYFDIYQNQAIARHNAGTFANTGSVQVDGTVTSGSIIPMKGFTPSATGVLLKGDLITVAGTNSVNPIGRKDTGQNIQFVVTADVDADGSGNANVPVSPNIISDLANPRRNVTNPLADNAVVTQAASYNSNFAYAKDGLDIVVPPLDRLDVPYSKVMTDRDANVSIRVSKDGDIINDVNVLRIDVLCGYKWHPQYAVKLIS